MMRIFYIDWQQHWKYDRTMNISANAHGKRAVSTLKTATSDRLDLHWHLGLQWRRIGIELELQVPRLFHNATVSQCNHFLLLHMYMYLLFETSPGWRGFFNSIWWGPLSSNVFTICAVYWSLGRRGYFGVSNVGLVSYAIQIRNIHEPHWSPVGWQIFSWYFRSAIIMLYDLRYHAG